MKRVDGDTYFCTSQKKTGKACGVSRVRAKEIDRCIALSMNMPELDGEKAYEALERIEIGEDTLTAIYKEGIRDTQIRKRGYDLCRK